MLLRHHYTSEITEHEFTNLALNSILFCNIIFAVTFFQSKFASG